MRFSVVMNAKKTFLAPVLFVACVGTLAVVDLGCQDSAEPVKTHYPAGKLTPQDGFMDQNFGTDVAVSGSQAVVVSCSEGGQEEMVYAKSVDVFDLGLRNRTRQLVPLGDVRLKHHWRVSADDRWAAVAGYSEYPSKAYVFDLRTGKQKSVLKPDDDLFPNDLFGNSISLKGDRVIVGAITAKRGGDSDRPGAAYIFAVEDGKQIFKLVSKDAKHGDVFGCSVAISDSYAVVGASGTATDGLEGSGAAYVFDIRTGKQISVLTVRRPVGGEAFGEAVAIFGDMVVIGAPKDRSLVKGPGAAYLYNVRSGKMLAELKPSDGSGRNFFGGAVGISERLVVVGAVLAESANGKETGAAYVFDSSTGKELAKFSARDLKSGTMLDEDVVDLELGSGFGVSVGVTSDWIVVGSPGNDFKGVTDVGAVYMFKTTEIYSNILGK
jgi:hypothetical protein